MVLGLDFEHRTFLREIPALQTAATVFQILTQDLRDKLLLLEDDHGNTCLHYATEELADLYLKTISKTKQLDLLMKRNNKGAVPLLTCSVDAAHVLLKAVGSDYVVEYLFSQDTKGKGFLHHAFDHGCPAWTGGSKFRKALTIIESLLKQDHVDTILTMTDSKGRNIFHNFIDTCYTYCHPEAYFSAHSCGYCCYKISCQSTKLVFGMLSAEGKQKLAMQTSCDGKTIFHHLYDVDVIQHALMCLPDDQRYSVVSSRDKDGCCVLHRMQSCISFKVFLDALTVDEGLKAIYIRDNRGNTVLHCQANCSIKVRYIVELLPSEWRESYIMARNWHPNPHCFGFTALHSCALFNEHASSLRLPLHDVFELLLQFLSEDNQLRLAYYKVGNGDTILSLCSYDVKLFTTVLTLIPEDWREEYLLLKNNDGQTIAHQCSGEVLKLL